MANQEHVAILRQGGDEWNRWLEREHGTDKFGSAGVRADLSEADLSKQPSAGGLFMLEAGVRGIAEIPFAG